MSDEVTLCIPYYRGRDYLKIAVESVLAQDDDAWRLAIRDDGERGEAASILAALGIAHHPRVRCTSNATNLGMVANWNACLDVVETPLAALLHADDALETSYVRTMRALARSQPSGTAFFCEARIVDARGRERFSFADWIKRFYQPRTPSAAGELVLQGEGALRAVMAGNFIMCPTLCFRVAKLAGRRFDPSYRQAQDLELTSRLLMDGDTLVGTQARAYAYRRHAAGATAVQTESLLRFREELALFDQVAARATSLGWTEAARVSRRKTIVRLHLGYRAAGDLARLRFRRAIEELQLALTGGQPPA